MDSVYRNEGQEVTVAENIQNASSEMQQESLEVVCPSLSFHFKFIVCRSAPTLAH